MGTNYLKKRTRQERLIIAKTLLETVLDDMRFAQKVQLSEEDATSDLISRQEAIRLAEQGQIQGFEWQFKKLCTLPSAEPEIIQCKNCQYWNTGNCNCPDIRVDCLDYYVGDLVTEEDFYCGFAKRREGKE